MAPMKTAEDAHRDMERQVEIRVAEWPRERHAARALLGAYRDFLERNPGGSESISVPGYEQELESMERRWGGSDAALLLAWERETALGCVAVQMLGYREGACEIKRMWVGPLARGMGLGRSLVRAAEAWGSEHGARELLLDTVPEAMPEALRLYRSEGFVTCERYNENPVPGVIFLRKPLG